jgi:hypothetical protein
MRSNPSASPYMEQALALAKFDPGMFEVVEDLPKPITNAWGSAAAADLDTISGTLDMQLTVPVTWQYGDERRKRMFAITGITGNVGA